MPSSRRRCTCRRRSCRTRSTRSSWATSRWCGPCTRRRPPASFAEAIENEIRQITGVPVIDTETMEEVVAISTSRERFNMLLMSIFGGAALVLAALGIYGLLAYSVQQRDARARDPRRARRRAEANQGHDPAAGRRIARRGRRGRPRRGVLSVELPGVGLVRRRAARRLWCSRRCRSRWRASASLSWEWWRYARAASIRSRRCGTTSVAVR